MNEYQKHSEILGRDATTLRVEVRGIVASLSGNILSLSNYDNDAVQKSF